MTNTHRRITAVLALGAALLAAGCSTPTTQFYSLAETTPPTSAAATTAMPIYIELGPVVMAERFMQPQMVVRQKDASNGPQVSILEQSRWASPFDSEMRDALASGIASRLGAVDVSGSGRQGGQPVTRIAVQMGQFDAVVDSRVDAAFSWTLRRSDAAPVAGCKLALSEPVGAGIDSLAQGAQRVTSKLADAIAASVKALQANQSPPCAG